MRWRLLVGEASQIAMASTTWTTTRRHDQVLIYAELQSPTVTTALPKHSPQNVRFRRCRERLEESFLHPRGNHNRRSGS
jgi:hypothetical protein